uniref:Uncharacterized protein n=1 Tax=Spongospora subterranea TaxID=70186 RepID=A0A0H5QVG5_9EUKA|eukprot:CRZ05737.1 hypothetical protein [Spongospora subterranea]
MIPSLLLIVGAMALFALASSRELPQTGCSTGTTDRELTESRNDNHQLSNEIRCPDETGLEPIDTKIMEFLESKKIDEVVQQWADRISGRVDELSESLTISNDQKLGTPFPKIIVEAIFVFSIKHNLLEMFFKTLALTANKMTKGQIEEIVNELIVSIAQYLDDPSESLEILTAPTDERKFPPNEDRFFGYDCASPVISILLMKCVAGGLQWQ